MTYRLLIMRRAEDELAALDPLIRHMVVNYMKKYLDNSEAPRDLAGSKPLPEVENGWRWKVGRFRLLGTIGTDTLTICCINDSHGLRDD